MLRNRFEGNPELDIKFSIANAQPVVFSECFKTTPFPAIRAGAANLRTCQKGKFQGMIESIIPRG